MAFYLTPTSSTPFFRVIACHLHAYQTYCQLIFRKVPGPFSFDLPLLPLLNHCEIKARKPSPFRFSPTNQISLPVQYLPLKIDKTASSLIHLKQIQGTKESSVFNRVVCSGSRFRNGLHDLFPLYFRFTKNFPCLILTDGREAISKEWLELSFASHQCLSPHFGLCTLR